jgi:hypothetical protein
MTVLAVTWGTTEHICALSRLSLLLSLLNKSVPPEGGEWDRFLLFVNFFLPACSLIRLFAGNFRSYGAKGKLEECAGNTKDG